MSEQTNTPTGEKSSSAKKRPRSKSVNKSSSKKKRPRSKSVNKSSSKKKRPRSKSVKKSSSKKKRPRSKSAKKSSSKYALDLTIAMIATIALSLVHDDDNDDDNDDDDDDNDDDNDDDDNAINPTVATSSGRRERKLDNGNNFRDYKIDPKDFLKNPWKYGLKILKELAELGGKTRKSNKGRVNNRVFRCETCDHSDYKDDMIVYAIFIEENVADTLVGRITWVCDYGMAILRDYDCRIYAKKPTNSKTAYAMVKIPIDGETKLVQVHALLFNKVLLDKENRRGIFRETDHIDNSDEATNGLNNLLVNVRDGAPDGTNRLNMSNRSTFKNNTSGHKGVGDRKGRNEGGSYGDFGFWRVKYNEFDKDTKETREKYKLFSRIKNGEAHKREMFEEACKFREEKTRKYVDDLEEWYKPIRALHDLWFSADLKTQDVVRSFERHGQSLRPSILELTRSSK